jgi:hypothetical protein
VGRRKTPAGGVGHVQRVGPSFAVNDLAPASPLLVHPASCEVEHPPPFPEEDEMSAAGFALDPCARVTESAVAELRRAAVSAVVRQQQVREELDAIRTQAGHIERRAARALARGDDLIGRQILARGIFTLKARDALEAELAECRTHVARLLASMVQAQKRAWQATSPPASWRR